jgi:hypothetical protein
MRKSSLLAFAAATLVSGGAGAASISVLTPPGTLMPPSGTGPVATFNSITPTAWGQTTATGPFLDGGASFSGSGVVMNNLGQGSAGLYATPFGDATNYMAVLGGGTETIAYASEKTFFGLYWGSVDNYNLLTFYEGATQVATISGSQTGPLIASGGQGDYSSNGYVLISGLPKFDSVMVTSGSNSFEFDNVVAGVPEPSTWMMMGLGFAGLGLVAFNNQSKKKIARAIA